MDDDYVNARTQLMIQRIYDISRPSDGFTFADARNMALAALRAWQEYKLESRIHYVDRYVC